MPTTRAADKGTTLDKAAQQEKAPARKRGRPPKKVTAEPTAENKGEKNEQEVATLNVSQNEEPIKRKRGRPRKVQPEEAKEEKKEANPPTPKRG
ncbi:uncharacterized protein B0P05DRAFT_554252, partial [Gilbertella persicaria]|uniref:uncharacterized protein n=1 Tax=Gilbertella persicaria TaxID=101096 RepID=UPI00221F8E8D